MKGQHFQINTERSSFTLCVQGQTGGQIEALLVRYSFEYISFTMAIVNLIR